MELRRLTVENFRGFNDKHPIDLDARFLLFYGLNGRGKSSIFQALELVMFPEQVLDRYRRDAGERAPLTNRFHREASEQAGAIHLELDWEGARTELTQEVRDTLDENSVQDSAIRKSLARHRHGLFFSQRVLRDLILASPSQRYDRFKELLGCDTYDQLTEALERWHYHQGYKAGVRELRLKEFEDVCKSLPAVLSELKGKLLEAALSALGGGKISTKAPGAFSRVAFDHLRSICPPLADKLGLGKTSLRTFGAISQRLYKVRKAAQRLRELMGDGSLIRTQQQAIPPTWLAEHDRLDHAWDLQFAEREGVRSQLAVSLSAEQLAELDRGTFPYFVNLDDRTNALLRRFAELKEDSHQVILKLLRVRAEWEELCARFAESAHKFAGAAARLRRVDDGLDLLRKDRSASAEESWAVLRQRRGLLRLVELGKKAIVELCNQEMEVQIKGLEPRWNEYHGELASFSHFQQLRISLDKDEEIATIDRSDARALFLNEDPLEDEYLLRFLAKDPGAKDGSEHQMEALLSEGQLNCAVVALVMALAEQNRMSLQFIALDDPFVSWDDVNTENFLGAMRRFVQSGWTILLTTCDPRIMTSAVKNMETLNRITKPAIIYTLKTWERERGLSAEPLYIQPKPTKHLAELPEFEGVEISGLE